MIGAPKLSPYAYDPAKAKQLLTEAGYPNGFTTSMQWPLEGGPNIRALAQVMISDWAKIGVTVKPLEKETRAVAGGLRQTQLGHEPADQRDRHW